MTTNTETIRWLHLSDFHVGKDDYASRKMFEYIIEHVLEQKARGFTPDFIFLTGDLANNGLQAEYEVFWLEFVDPLHTAIGGDISQRTFAVPGNHDVNRKEHPAFSPDEINAPNSRYFDPTDEGMHLRKMLAPRFKAYIENDITETAGAFSDANGAFAQTISVRGIQVGVAGINTAWISKDDKDERRLSPGKSLLEAALNQIKGAHLNIVLGHHPVSWLYPDQQKSIHSLLGKHNVLYLHGHLHEAWAEPNYGGGYPYLAIQAGAGFQARENEKWRNGLVWGEADLKTGEVKLQAWSWTPSQQAWTPASEAFHASKLREGWWHYELPHAKLMTVDYTRATREITPPRGWGIFDAEKLSSYHVDLEKEVALRFFDGAVPDWNTALSSSIPRRKIVGDLTGNYHDADTASRPIATVLLAAGCEGKTTALLQAAYEIIKGKANWRILQRRDDSQEFLEKEIIPVLNPAFNWLIVLDEVDRVAPALLKLIAKLPPELCGRVHCILGCRDSDWRSSGAEALDWSRDTIFHTERLNGLGQSDAESIVSAWQSFGEEGLGDLAKLPSDQRVNALRYQATAEAKTEAGAFFGALLTVRNGTDLHNHARHLLERLSHRETPGGSTLYDALAFIAAMHSEGFNFLSRAVLAEALNCPLDKLRRDVLIPLGQEAAATSTSSFLFTRHRRIAEALVYVLEEEFLDDVGSRYVSLARAALSAYHSGAYILELGCWRFDFASNFFEKGKKELALEIANTILSQEPGNSLTRTNLVSLYRRAGAPEESVRICLATVGVIDNNRAFYTEWGVAEGECKNHVANILLVAYSLSDECAFSSVDRETCVKALSAIGVPLGALYDAYGDPSFRDARMAIAILGKCAMHSAESQEYFNRHFVEVRAQGAENINIEKAFEKFAAGVVAAASRGHDAYLEEHIPSIHKMNFLGLEKLISNLSIK